MLSNSSFGRSSPTQTIRSAKAKDRLVSVLNHHKADESDNLTPQVPDLLDILHLHTSSCTPRFEAIRRGLLEDVRPDDMVSLLEHNLRSTPRVSFGLPFIASPGKFCDSGEDVPFATALFSGGTNPPT